MNSTSCFRKELLPPARGFYEKELGKLGRPNRSGWSPCRCPFHNSKSGKSFAVHSDGAFTCRGCDIKGGDVLSFVQLRYNLSFKAACQQLGAWRAEDNKPSELIPHRLAPWLRMDFAIDGNQYHAEVPDEARTELQSARKFHAEAKDRLSELHQGDAEKFKGEEEVYWGILANSWELIQMELEVRDGK
jgi:hypothetical protein